MDFVSVSNVEQSKPTEEKEKKSSLTLILSYQWFFTENVERTEHKDRWLTVKKCQADWFYYKQRYTEALNIYQGIRRYLPSNNSTLIRETMEATAQCLLKLGKADDALMLVSGLVSYCRFLQHCY